MQSCTNPYFQSELYENEELCPTPPRLSYDDVIFEATGRLDSDLVYVDEYLLEKANDLGAEVFIRRLLGGFVMSYEEPQFGSCGFGTKQVDVLELRGFIGQSFTQCTEIFNETEYYSYSTAGSDLLESLPWLSSEANCPLLHESGSSGFSLVPGGIDSESVVDGFSANLAQDTICEQVDDFDNDSSPQPIFTSSFLQQKIAATIYYNNNVRVLVLA